MPSMDIFRQDAFNSVSLTGAIVKAPYVPQFLGAMGLFQADGIYTTDIAIEEMDGSLTVIATSPRGAPPEQSGATTRRMRKFSTVRLARKATVNADQVQNVRAFGTESELQSVQGLINDRFNGPFGLRAAAELTHEYHRLGGIRGRVMDADGATELFDWYTAFGVAEPAEIDMDLDNAAAAEGAFLKKCQTLKRSVIGALGGLPTAQMELVALCGDNFFDDLTIHKDVREVWKVAQQGVALQENRAYSQFRFGGITWINYQGTEDGKVGIGTEQARIFPRGVPGMFQMMFAPADTFEFVNTKGLPVYAMMPAELQTSRAAVIEVQSNPLTICTRPLALRGARRT
ncbi:MAG: major capsid protein [Alphaproteobacteria bacterium]|nr:major capsid protein [Alphaproteobacteria bacterium]